MRHERSLQDAKTSNDLAKAAAQATILINGAAATALLAYAASVAKGAHYLRTLPWALSGYAIGVLFGAVMTIFLSLAIEKWMIRWFPETQEKQARIVEARAETLWRWSLIFFGLGMASFVIGSLLVAWGMLQFCKLSLC